MSTSSPTASPTPISTDRIDRCHFIGCDGVVPIPLPPTQPTTTPGDTSCTSCAREYEVTWESDGEAYLHPEDAVYCELCDGCLDDEIGNECPHVGSIEREGYMEWWGPGVYGQGPDDYLELVEALDWLRDRIWPSDVPAFIAQLRSDQPLRVRWLSGSDLERHVGRQRGWFRGDVLRLVIGGARRLIPMDGSRPHPEAEWWQDCPIAAERCALWLTSLRNCEDRRWREGTANILEQGGYYTGIHTHDYFSPHAVYASERDAILQRRQREARNASPASTR